jgi:large subunit ribosomal protein L1|tara:strand:- start:244 stop:924 length:681 start_codon:yes stop_codon:yes gene_type:complete
MSISKRHKENREVVDREAKYELSQAITILQDSKKTKFEESVDVAINLGIDPKQSDQNVRGSAALPNGTGKTLKIAVFAEGDEAADAKEAGADKIGMDDLAEEVKSGKMDFDMVIATPSSMKLVGQLGQILGPKGLMPNPKDGTVTKNVKDAVTNAKRGQAMYRNDKAGIIHCSIGKVGFKGEQIEENFNALLDDIKKSRPSSMKGIFIKAITMSSTMGPGIKIKES